MASPRRPRRSRDDVADMRLHGFRAGKEARPLCGASSWPFTVDDAKCVRDKGHDPDEVPHRTKGGFEW